ncbi:MAG: lipase family protein [Verrucomicrobiota bacterium]
MSEGAEGSSTPIPFEFAPASLATDQFSFAAAHSLAQASYLVYDDDLERVAKEVERCNARLASFNSLANPFSFAATQGMVLETEERLILVIRGSKGKEDWKLNLQAKQRRVWFDVPGKVHKGFWRALKHIWEPVVVPLMAAAGGSRKKVIICGHSLGGAIATLVAARIAKKFGLEALASVYTYGQPRVGNAKFASYVNEQFKGRFHRFVNDRDVVAMIPPAPLYRHVGELYHFDSDGSLIEITKSETGRKIGPTLTPEQFKEFSDSTQKHGFYTSIQEKKGVKPEVASVEDHSIDGAYIPKLKLHL